MKSRFLVLSIFLFVFLLTARGERLPLQAYSSAHGLASSVIHHIARDSRGFLWFCGRDGLSRFDGVEFVSFVVADDNPPSLFHFFLETSDGTYWIATDTGLFRVKPEEKTDVVPLSTQLRHGERRLGAKRVTKKYFWTLFEDRNGTLWAGGDTLFRIEQTEAEEVVTTEVGFDEEARAKGLTLLRDLTGAPDGSVWGAYWNGLVRILPNGKLQVYKIPTFTDYQDSYNIISDRQGRIWFAHSTGLFVLKPRLVSDLSAVPDRSVIKLEPRTVSIGRSGQSVLPNEEDGIVQLVPASGSTETVKDNRELTVMFESRDGRVWVPFRDSLFVFNGNRFAQITDSYGLGGQVRSIVEDDVGNLWFGSFSGVTRLSGTGLITYNRNAGLDQPNVHLIQSGPRGELLVVHGEWNVSRKTPDGFETVRLNVPPEAHYSWTSWPVFIDQNGAIWALSTNGLYRFPPRPSFREQTSQVPEKIVASPFLPASAAAYRAFSDRSGNVWISLRGSAGNRLIRYRDGELTDVSELPGYPRGFAVVSFAEDSQGTLWMGFYGRDGLFRFDGKEFVAILPEDGLIAGSIFAIHFDRRQRMWIASTGAGVAEVQDIATRPISLRRFDRSNGLASDNVRCLAGDNSGTVFAGTVRGVTRIEPETGLLSDITTADGLAADFVQSATPDADGAVWFGTSNGISRYEPTPSVRRQAPPVYISELEIAGEQYSISEFGQTIVEGLVTAYNRNNVRIDFVSAGDLGNVRYQYRLESGAISDWSSPGSQRSVNFSGLAPGDYRFLVRTVTLGGAVSEFPAAVSFRVSPPFWRSWWFISLAVILVCAGLTAFYRFRTEKLRQVNSALSDAREAEARLGQAREERLDELQKVRTRIATDLHDDIGASLTQIAVLSEVARKSVSGDAGSTVRPLESIAATSHELVEAMSDIVWAINPRKDSLRELILRMRRFASDLFTAHDIEFELIATDEEMPVAIGANVRREVFSIFKECVSNIVRHAGAQVVSINLDADRESVRMEIRDDGRGFDTNTVLAEDFSPAKGGNGLINIRRRARDLGGECVIVSSGPGTTVLLRVPLHRDFTSHIDGEVAEDLV